MNTLLKHAERKPERRGQKTPEPELIRLSHQIFVLDAYLDTRLDERHYQRITTRFVDELLAVLGIQALGELGIYPAVDTRAPGWSFIQPITTSHVSAHYFEKPGPKPHIRLDACSCESIDWTALIDVCHRHFCLRNWQATFIEREIDRNGQRKVTELSGMGPRVIAAHDLYANKRNHPEALR